MTCHGLCLLDHSIGDCSQHYGDLKVQQGCGGRPWLVLLQLAGCSSLINPFHLVVVAPSCRDFVRWLLLFLRLLLLLQRLLGICAVQGMRF